MDAATNKSIDTSPATRTGRPDVDRPPWPKAPRSLVGPEGTVVLADGLVNVSRRLEVDAAKASALGLRDQEVVRVLVASEKPRELPEVLVMVRPGPPFFCIDVHEAVSLEINGDSRAFVVESPAH